MKTRTLDDLAEMAFQDPDALFSVTSKFILAVQCLRDAAVDMQDGDRSEVQLNTLLDMVDELESA